MRFSFLRGIFGRKQQTVRRLPQTLRTSRLLVELLEDRAVPTVLPATVQSDYFGTSLPNSQPRSLRGLALSADETALYTGFIQGSTSAAIREVSSSNLSQIIGNTPNPDPSNPPYDTGLTAAVSTSGQPKGVATDDRGFVYATNNSGANASIQSWAIYQSDLTAPFIYNATAANFNNGQLAGISTYKFDPDGMGPTLPTYYAYLSWNRGSSSRGLAQIERWNVTTPSAAFLDTTWGTSGQIDLRTPPAFGSNAFANGLEVDDDGTIFVAGGVSGMGRGDAVFRIPADGNLAMASVTSVLGAMDVALYQGRVYATQFLSNLSTVAVLRSSNLELLDTIGFTSVSAHTTNATGGTDDGYSGIDIKANGLMYVADQLYDKLTGTYTPPGGSKMTTATVFFDRVLTASLGSDNVGPITSGASVTPNMPSITYVGNFTLTASVDDSTTGNSTVIASEYSLDGGMTWKAMTATDGKFDNPTEAVTATFSVADLPGAGVYTILIRGTDAAGNTGATDSTVLTLLNAPPIITGSVAGQMTDDQTAISPFSSVMIADADSPPQLVTVTVTLSAAANGMLSGGGFVPGMTAGTYTFTGTAPAATTAINALLFTPTNNQIAPTTTATTTFTIDVNDGSVTTTDMTTTVIATSLNDPPTIVGAVAGQMTTDKVPISPFTTVTIGDVDNPTQTLTVTIALSAAANGTLSGGGFTPTMTPGTYTFTGTAAAATTAIQAVVFTPTVDQVPVGMTVTTTFTITADDGLVMSPTTNNTTTVLALSVNTAPSILGTVPNQMTTDNLPINPFSGVMIVDPNSPPQNVTVTVIQSNVANGVLSGGFTPTMTPGTYTFTGTVAAATTAIQALVFTPTVDQVTPGLTVITGFTIIANDGVAPPVMDSVTSVRALSVNYTPTISNVTTALQTLMDPDTVIPFPTVTIGDADSPPQVLTVSVFPNVLANGVFSAASLAASGFQFYGNRYSFVGLAAAATTAIRQLVFVPTINQVTPGQSVFTNFHITVDDGAVLVGDNKTTISVLSKNDAPTIGGTLAGQAVTDKTTIKPFNGVTIGNVDYAQPVTVLITGSPAANGALSGTGLSSLGGGVYKLTGTAAVVTAAIKNVVFTPTKNQVTPGSSVTTGFTVTVNDGVAPIVSDAVTTVLATSINDAPTIGGTATKTVNDNATVLPFTTVTISDVDSPAQTQTVTVALSAAANGTLAGGGFAPGMTAGTYTFTGTAAQSQAAIRLLVFTPTANQVAPGLKVATTFTISVDDSMAVTNNSATLVTATSINNAPTITGAALAQPVNDNATILPFAGVTIADVDVPGQTQTVTVMLSSATNGILTGGFTPGVAGTYTFTGSAAAATTAIKALVFTPKNNQVTPGSTVTTTFTIRSNDGLAITPNTGTSVVALSINDAPTLVGTLASQAVTDKTTIKPFSGVTIGDVDYAQPVTVLITGSPAVNGVLSGSGLTSLGGGVYRLIGTAANVTTAIKNVVFTPTKNQVVPTSIVTTGFTVTVNDGVAPIVSDAVTTVLATSVNDAPTIGGTGARVVNDNATVMPFTAVTIADLDNPAQTQTVTVALSTAANGTLAGGGFVPGMTAGTYTFTGTAAQAQTAIRQLVFTPTANQVAPGLKVTTTFTISVNDGIVVTNNSAATVAATSINDGPSVSGIPALTSISSSSTATPFSTANISDPDVPAQNLTVTISFASASGAFSAASLLSSGFVKIANGQYRFVGTDIAAQAAIRLLVFVPTGGLVSPGRTLTTAFTISVSDGFITKTASTSLAVSY